MRPAVCRRRRRHRILHRREHPAGVGCAPPGRLDELAEPARAEIAAEQSRLADLARGGPLGPTVVRAVESGTVRGAVSMGAPEAAETPGVDHGGKAKLRATRRAQAQATAVEHPPANIDAAGAEGRRS